MGLTWAEVISRYTDAAELVGVWGGTRARQLASQYDVAAEASLDRLLARRDVDAVVIASPLATHHAYVLGAARAGKHIFLEKPMAVTLAEADEMVLAATEADVRLAVVTQHRFRRTPLAAKRLIDEGAIGDVRMVHARGMLSWPNPAPGHVPWGELGYHVCDVLRWLVGSDPIDVSARFASYGPPVEPAKSVMATYRFASGALGHVWLSYEVPPPGLGSQMQYDIVGSLGMIDLDSYAAVRLSTPDGWQVVDEQPQGDPGDALDPVRIETYAGQFRDFLDAVAGHREPLVGGRDGRKTTAMLLGAIAADRTNGPVRLDGRAFETALR